jgi:hypothetical protein
LRDGFQPTIAAQRNEALQAHLGPQVTKFDPASTIVNAGLLGWKIWKLKKLNKHAKKLAKVFVAAVPHAPEMLWNLPIRLSQHGKIS